MAQLSPIPYGGNQLTYGQGPEHKFFDWNYAPSEAPAAAVPQLSPQLALPSGQQMNVGAGTGGTGTFEAPAWVDPDKKATPGAVWDAMTSPGFRTGAFLASLMGGVPGIIGGLAGLPGMAKSANNAAKNINEVGLSKGFSNLSRTGEFNPSSPTGFWGGDKGWGGKGPGRGELGGPAFGPSWDAPGATTGPSVTTEDLASPFSGPGYDPSDFTGRGASSTNAGSDDFSGEGWF